MDPKTKEQLEDLIGWLDAASSVNEPRFLVIGKVSAAVVADRLRGIVNADPESSENA